MSILSKDGGRGAGTASHGLAYENPAVFDFICGIKVPLLSLQMLSIGAEMENNQRKIRQREVNVAYLLDKSELSVRRIAGITGHSINTVRKVKQLKEI